MTNTSFFPQAAMGGRHPAAPFLWEQEGRLVALEGRDRSEGWEEEGYRGWEWEQGDRLLY